ncbi:tRNA epoxyqueuosine(34) reductase QueG [Neptunomonas antarctica]|uniref:Epoxyqueuosine reductase n=1 Tax=Neptunomonas antarctica TaxID=619304 RepID=A0A1N7P8E3_9GAMM|nr:tRNA epoxyqueuosine(34) reductase QueG [Neptunomonas antarctica]SIT06853.1 epoxyqueuosine reductase [Neptunomonas antarctica]
MTDSDVSTQHLTSPQPSPQLSPEKLAELAKQIHIWASEYGFQQCGIVDPDLKEDAARLQAWLEKQYHGEMNYLAANADKRRDPYSLVPGSCRIISVRMDYTPPAFSSLKILNSPEKAYIARYTLGRDYHKMMRKRLTQLGKRIEEAAGEMGYRAFVDSAPVMERPIAQQAGLGWTGKHTLILNRHAGSWFFLGELFIDLPLPTDLPEKKTHCGSCTACLDICPTNAFTGPYELDATRCISYLTIEKKGSIPEELRSLMGNRIFGCDDCQLVCPWNRFAKHTAETDFHPRHQLDDISLVDLFNWDEATFLKRTEGSAIRRTGYEGWLRNIAIALGNSGGGNDIITTLEAKRPICSEMVIEHIDWAINQLKAGQTRLSPIQFK